MASIRLAWNDNSTNEDNFIFERKVVGGSFAAIATLDPNVAIYLDETLLPDTDYVYRVYAENTGGPSGYSNELPVSVKSLPARQGLRVIYV